MENMIVELENISVHYLDKEIININRLAVHQFDRIGIVGKNGAGKSTLLQLLAGEIQPNTGIVKQHVQAGYFKQIESPAEKEVDGALLSKLDIVHVQGESSGGEKTKRKLAELFSDYHEVLLIDEPTTHLDKRGIAFLKDQLHYYYGALLLVSHDRKLLDQLVTTIWEISEGHVKVYKGNYTEYAALKQLEIEQQLQARENYLKEKDRLERAAEEKMEKAQRMLRTDAKSKQKANEKPSRLGKSKSKATSQKGVHRAAKSIEHRIENLSETEAIKEEKSIVFYQSKTLALYNKFPIMADQLTLQVNGTTLLKEVSFQFPLGKNIALTGPNGAGKSTLLHYIANRGEGLIISPKAKIGFFQQMSYQFRTDETIIKFMKKRFDKTEGFLRSVLNKMQFTGVDLRKKVKSLSGGEAVRLQLCQLFLGEYNILLLDEPTNFLDIQALEALEEFVLGYEGTVVIVTHDETFVNHVADIQFMIEPNTCTINQIS